MRVNYLHLFILLIISIVDYCICSTSFEFDRKYFGVSFTPYVKKSYYDGNLQRESYTYENIENMLTVISGKFAKVLVRDIYTYRDEYIHNITYWNGSYASVYSGEIAAKINQANAKNALTVLYVVKVHDSVEKTNVEIQLVLEAAEKANEIHPGTVEGVILKAYDFDRLKMQQILYGLKTYGGIASKLKIKIGAALECMDILDHDTDDLDILKKNIIAESEIISCRPIFPINFKNMRRVALSSDFVKEMLKARETITRINHRVTVIGNFGCSSSGLQEWETIENLGLFFESVNKFASNENYTTFMFEAFDNPWRHNPPSTAHLGWWKLEYNSQINSVGGYVEKISENATCCFKFDRNHFGVSFTPYVKQAYSGNFSNTAYTYENIETMLTVLSGKFSNLLIKGIYAIRDEYIPNITYWNGSYASVYSGEIAAKINRANGKKVLMLLYEILLVEETNVEIQLVLEAAEKANEIYPGTVEGIILYTDNFDRSNMEQVLDSLNKYGGIASTLQIKIGAALDCIGLFRHGNDDLVRLQEGIIAQSEIIGCGISPGNQSVGPVVEFESVARDLLIFRKIITILNPNVKVIANVLGWSSSGMTKWETVNNIRLYWESASKFSSTENYTIYLDEAFDNPRQNIPLNLAHLGWWKLENNSQINSIGGYVEKISAVRNDVNVFSGAVVIKPDVMKNILNSKIPLQDDYSEDFFSIFTEFLVEFDWSNNSRNDILQATAEHNKGNIANYTVRHGKNAIHLWLSFQPRNDIADDLDVIADAITTTNARYPGTVSTVVLNYGLLAFSRGSIPLVKQDMQRFNKKFKSLGNQNLRLGLQFHAVNCLNQVAFTESLEYRLVDLVIITPQGKHLDPYYKSDARHYKTLWQCAFLHEETTTGTFDTLLTINITLQNHSYSYNQPTLSDIINIVNEKLYFKQTRFLIHAEIERQSSNDSFEYYSSRNNFEEWLRQESKFNSQNFGVWYDFNGQNLNFEAVRKTIISLNLHKLVLSSDAFAGGSKTPPFITELLIYKESTKDQSNSRKILRRGDTPLEIYLLVTLISNELETNKRKIESICSAAVEANAEVHGIKATIIFDWAVCNNSSVNNGCNELQEPDECLVKDNYYDTLLLLNYTSDLIANKMQNNGRIKINPIVMIDEYFLSKLVGTEICSKFQRLDKIRVLPPKKVMCKLAVNLENLTKIGATKISANIIDKFVQCWSPGFAVATVSYYLILTGCIADAHADIRQLVEYVKLVENINNWAEYVNTTVFVNMGIEDAAGCGRLIDKTLQKDCTCGWWIQGKSMMPDPNHIATLQNKKSVALQIFEASKKASSRTPSQPYSHSSVSTEMLLMILIPAILFAILLSSLTVFLVFHYKSKDAMSKEEVRNFFKGKIKPRATNDEACDSNNAAENEPYNMEKYELKPSSFTIDTSSNLGSGEFGKVHLGSIKLQRVEIEAAVKVTKTLGKSYGFYMSLKGLISEIKILSYVGNHLHVVSLLGAYTAKLRKGDIAVFLEYCPLGSLDKYLRSIKPQQAISDDDEASPTSSVYSVNRDTDAKVLDKETAELLSRWPREIACGMEFLTSKNVVHADLATRNILLTADKTVKIADFGLSRRLYDYSEYVKKNQGALPWRWMAPESLRRMLFNEKTDVWAFGVTLWEMFSLGDEPYPGLTWHVNFPAVLERGLLMPEPKYNLKGIYSVMVRCWNLSPVLRPSFAELSSELTETN